MFETRLVRGSNDSNDTYGPPICHCWGRPVIADALNKMTDDSKNLNSKISYDLRTWEIIPEVNVENGVIRHCVCLEHALYGLQSNDTKNILSVIAVIMDKLELNSACRDFTSEEPSMRMQIIGNFFLMIKKFQKSPKTPLFMNNDTFTYSKGVCA